MPAGLLAPADSLNHLKPDSGIPSDSFRSDTALDDDKIITKELPLSEHPYVLYLPRIRRPPRIINNRPPKPVDKHSVYNTYLNNSEITINVIVDLKFDMHSFYRFLAKLAHGVAVSHFGLNRIKPFLNEIIIDGTLDLRSYYIGRNIDAEFGPKRGSTCNLKTFQKEIRGIKYICTTIQLFSNIDGILNGRPTGTPIYFAVVGEFIA
ncbi:hypothetical protein QEV83_02680 [Methylocapsa sp. D3K7]|uniref:hypothetical protein n=1 Tax=Methylocapsa sp. D3K7 TaxID=3041435 RepID=UPI00244EC274|nr:hypothetical protein [Methylocapsa sp. D3K7]WGJ15224.1 hypothetical protein QEV83_02680 [Methylocapsa sp. D3K7]